MFRDGVPSPLPQFLGDIGKWRRAGRLRRTKSDTGNHTAAVPRRTASDFSGPTRSWWMWPAPQVNRTAHTPERCRKTPRGAWSFFLVSRLFIGTLAEVTVILASLIAILLFYPAPRAAALAAVHEVLFTESFCVACVHGRNLRGRNLRLMPGIAPHVGQCPRLT